MLVKFDEKYSILIFINKLTRVAMYVQTEYLGAFMYPLLPSNITYEGVLVSP